MIGGVKSNTLNRKSAGYNSGFADGNTGKPSKIDAAKPANAAHPGVADYMTGYAVGKQAYEARNKGK